MSLPKEFRRASLVPIQEGLANHLGVGPEFWDAILEDGYSYDPVCRVVEFRAVAERSDDLLAAIERRHDVRLVKISGERPFDDGPTLIDVEVFKR